MDLESIDEMKKRGVTVIEVGADGDAAGWDRLGASFAERLRRNVPDELFAEALRHRATFRAMQVNEGTDPP